MALRRWIRRLYEKLLPGGEEHLRAGREGGHARRGAIAHVVILDGTMSSLVPGDESNAGRIYRILSRRRGAHLNLYYEAGLQWQDWRSTLGVMMGRGIHRQIRRAYGHLASRYRPGDTIYLIGFSRGAYAVRSLAGAIETVGLLRQEEAMERNVLLAWRYYRTLPSADVLRAHRRARCHDAVPIEMVGVFDTVKALGLRLPILWRWGAASYEFHSHELGESVRHGYHALALEETRVAYRPVLWWTVPDTCNDVQQMWFRGAHGDVGGHLMGFEPARPLANIPLVWMLERGAAAGLPLPEDWRDGLQCDVRAPSVGTWRGWGWLFLLRARRQVGGDPSEAVHETARNGTAPPLGRGGAAV
ncbi:DUF2235 domain-containing protein [Roseovarius sp. S4756]|uniref:DUF2235 domain-containing protein n=1 Tax=Roseovarius maritimus TaxID=3342637 RepID=UPI00372C9D6B